MSFSPLITMSHFVLGSGFPLVFERLPNCINLVQTLAAINLHCTLPTQMIIHHLQLN